MVLSLRMEIQETDEQRPDEQQVAIYSKWAILGFSICFSPILGGILLMLNLRSVGLKKEGTSVLLFAIAYRVVSGILLSSIIKLPANANSLELLTNTRFMMYSLVGDIIGGGILAEYFFKKYFPADHYEYKSVIRPLLVMIILIITLGFLVRI